MPVTTGLIKIHAAVWAEMVRNNTNDRQSRPTREYIAA
jgi:hypothetical protein